MLSSIEIYLTLDTIGQELLILSKIKSSNPVFTFYYSESQNISMTVGTVRCDLILEDVR